MIDHVRVFTPGSSKGQYFNPRSLLLQSSHLAILKPSKITPRSGLYLSNYPSRGQQQLENKHCYGLMTEPHILSKGDLPK